MGLLQKRPQIGESIQLYSLGLNKTVLIVGLGNPGKKYDDTRHNVGFTCLDEFAKANEFPGWVNKKDLECSLTQATLGDTRVLLIKPITFMNLSGEAVQAVANFYKIAPEGIVVVHDELDVPFGQIRTRVGGSAAGHNGIKSVIEKIGEGFGRVRVGIGPKMPEQVDSADFVLQKFTTKEQAEMSPLTREVLAILSEYVFGDHVLPHEIRSFIL